ncbi:hypothetical protein Y032_0018g3497 [Ancylostoma ceylanicum]|uniref:Protein kinase domain-containing protein n=2 Tax=Ancylostoma ceylanicum TaxID=53326 RepID=A0A016V2N8_9BILA|nr:hypothetical protein Y032_0018g3497 [Ancylostoma ceylanicum]
MLVAHEESAARNVSGRFFVTGSDYSKNVIITVSVDDGGPFTASTRTPRNRTARAGINVCCRYAISGDETRKKTGEDHQIGKKRLEMPFRRQTTLIPAHAVQLRGVPSRPHVGRVCTVSTQVRIGINALYGVKVLHDMGFIHRDLKPANMAMGSTDSDRSRLIHIFDFGLAREYVFFSQNERPKLRRPRAFARFRGTLRYCSVNTQERGEQGRMDDLWSLLHILVELRGALPWSRAQTAAEILHFKRSTPMEILLENCPVQLMIFQKHLSTLNYYTRPDYLLLYNSLENIRTRGNISTFTTDNLRDAEPKMVTKQVPHVSLRLPRENVLTPHKPTSREHWRQPVYPGYSDPYDWEFDQALQTQQSGSTDQLNRQSPAASMQPPFKSPGRPGVDVVPDINPFPAEYFASNPLGF